MANISTLTVSLVAETAKFSNGLKKSRRDASQFGFAIKKAFGAAAIGVGALTGAFGVLTRQSLQLVDQQRKTARTLNTTQAIFSGLSLAAGISGQSVESFTKALKRQSKSIVDANDGLQTQARAFDRLGLSTKALLGLPIEKQFAAITTALGKVDNATLRVGIASDIYGAKNADLINILELGESGLDGFIRKVEELGVALTEKQTKAIEEANDSTLLLKTAFQGLGNQLAARFAPSIKNAQDALAGLVQKFTQSIPTIAAWTASIFGVERALDSLTIKDLTAEILLLDKSINKIKGELNGVQNLLSFQPNDASALEFEKTLNAELEQLLKRYNDAIRARGELRRAGEGTEAPTVTTGVDVTGSGLGGPATELSRLDPLIVDVSIKVQRLRDRFREWQSDATRAINDTRTPVEKLNETIDRLRANPFVDAELQRRATQEAVDAYIEEMKRIADETKKEVDEASEFWLEGMRSMQRSFSDVLFTGFTDGTGDMVDSFKDALRRMLADLAASKLLEFVFGFLGRTFPGLGIPLPGSGTSTPGRRIGGSVNAGQRILGGEGGAEVFTPSARGALRPLGAVTVEQTNTIGTGNGNLSLATLIPVLEDNNKKLKAEIMEAFDRGAFA